MKNKSKKVILLVLFLLINIFFIDFVSAKGYNNYSDSGLSCGENLISDIPAIFPNLTSKIYILLQVIVPIIVVIFGSIDLVKGVMASKEDEIKKGQQIFIKRLIYGVIVFFVFSIVKFVISLVSDDNNVLSCAECFIKGSCESSKDIFVCPVGDYEFYFNSDGSLHHVNNASGLNNEYIRGFSSEFSPKNVLQCPTETEAEAVSQGLGGGTPGYKIILKKK